MRPKTRLSETSSGGKSNFRKWFKSRQTVPEWCGSWTGHSKSYSKVNTLASMWNELWDTTLANAKKNLKRTRKTAHLTTDTGLPSLVWPRSRDPHCNRVYLTKIATDMPSTIAGFYVFCIDVQTCMFCFTLDAFSGQCSVLFCVQYGYRRLCCCCCAFYLSSPYSHSIPAPFNNIHRWLV